MSGQQPLSRPTRQVLGSVLGPARSGSRGLFLVPATPWWQQLVTSGWGQPGECRQLRGPRFCGEREARVLSAARLGGTTQDVTRGTRIVSVLTAGLSGCRRPSCSLSAARTPQGDRLPPRRAGTDRHPQCSPLCTPPRCFGGDSSAPGRPLLGDGTCVVGWRGKDQRRA